MPPGLAWQRQIADTARAELGMRRISAHIDTVMPAADALGTHRRGHGKPYAGHAKGGHRVDRNPGRGLHHVRRELPDGLRRDALDLHLGGHHEKPQLLTERRDLLVSLWRA